MSGTVYNHKSETLYNWHLNLNSHMWLVAPILDRAVFIMAMAIPVHPGWTSALLETTLPDSPNIRLFLLLHLPTSQGL